MLESVISTYLVLALLERFSDNKSAEPDSQTVTKVDTVPSWTLNLPIKKTLATGIISSDLQII